MKKSLSALTIVTITTMILISISFNMKTVGAANSGYAIEHVDHTIEVMYNGYIFINDTMRIVGNAPEGTKPLDSFLIGFPYKYGPHVLRSVAYDESGVFNVTLNVLLENQMGYYAVNVTFPRPLDITNGTAHVFTVGFMLSNDLLTTTETNRYILDFPAYPSLTKAVSNCNVTILPHDMTDMVVSKDDGTVNASTYVRENLPAFTNMPADVTFSLPLEKMQLFDVLELKREVRIDGVGEIEGSDSYYLTSKSATEMTVVDVVLPANASDISAQDQFGRTFERSPEAVENETNRYLVFFTLPLEIYKSTRFTLKYSLPTNIYFNAQGRVNLLNVTSLLFQHVNYYIDQASLTFIFPEGARVLSPETTLTDSTYSVTTSVFQETLTINKQGIGRLEDVITTENLMQIEYEYNYLWLSFRPTIWMWALAVVGCAIAVAWTRRKAPLAVAVPTVALRLRPEYIKSFVDSYEERRKIALEMDSLEAMVQKGRIPRRRYKVRRKTLEIRLDTLSRGLTESKEKMRGAGGKYADLMRQLEIAETEISEVEANIKSIEVRHSRGEISLEAHRKLLADYERRKETAETTINGILLRLREEIR